MKKTAKIWICVIAALLAIAAGICVLCLSFRPSFYTTAQHVSRIRRRAEKRYLTKDSEYTGLEVYPLYDEEDKLDSFLIELQPAGYVYVTIIDDPFTNIMLRVMYDRQALDVNTLFYPYVYEEGAESTIVNEFGNTETLEGVRVLQDENGEQIVYHCSPYAAAGVQDEKLYLITVGAEHMPAVRRGDNFLNLISGKEVPCTTDFRSVKQGEIEYEHIYFPIPWVRF